VLAEFQKKRNIKKAPGPTVWHIKIFSSASTTTTMSENTPPTFDSLHKFPTEIRSMIFGYMIQNYIESQIELPDYGLPHAYRNDFHTLGLSAYGAKEHLTKSPWITLNKQYCAEYLQAFVREVELTARFSCIYTRHFSESDKGRWLVQDVLPLITSRFNIAGPHAGIDTSSKALISRIKGICFSYHYYGSFFARGFSRTELRRFPDKGFLTKPLKLLRQYHEDYNIPANKLSIHISYGDPAWNILACLRELERNTLPAVPQCVVSIHAVQVQIYVDGYDASVADIDRKIEVLRVGVGKIIERMRVKYPSGGYSIRQLETMINGDMDVLRRVHLKVIDEVTTFWKAQDGSV
jgi:hypothetical protein